MKAVALTGMVGLPDSAAVMAQAPARVQVLLLGTIHQARTIAASPTQDDEERIEVTTACGLTGTTALWRYPTFQMLTTSTSWATRSLERKTNPPCPRCFPANAGRPGEVAGD